MGKFKQMQIEIDDDFNTKIEDPEEEPMPEYDSASEDTLYYNDAAENALSDYVGKMFIGCIHHIKIAFTRKTVVTYCEHCGKIFEQAKRLHI